MKRLIKLSKPNWQVLVFFLSVILLEATIAKTPAEQFNEAMKVANLLQNTVRSDGDTIKVIKSTGEAVTFDPQTVFKNQPGGYSSNPPQVGYGIDTNAMKNAAELGITQVTANKDTHDTQAVGKMVADNSRTRPIFKVSQDDDFIVKSNRAIDGAQHIVRGKSSSEINCEEKIEEKCTATFEQKICNEEIRTVKRICEKVPQITLIDEPYANCQKHTSPPAIEDCLAGEIPIPHYAGTGYGTVVIPKNRGARVGFSDSKHPHYYITATNETTGEIVISRRQVSNGYYIELPISKAQDQTFSFVVERWDQCSCNQPGRMKIYINYWRKIPQIEWQEGACRDI